MLATSVVSVSFAPAALAVCLNKSASSYMPLLSRGAFSLAIFPQSAKSIAEHIAAADSSHRFDKGSWTRLEAQGSAMHGLPLLKEAGGTLLCRVDSRMDYG